MDSFKKLRKNEAVKRVVKYLLHAFIIAFAVRYLTTCEIDTQDTLIIAMISAVTFAILDMFSPAIITN